MRIRKRPQLRLSATDSPFPAAPAAEAAAAVSHARSVGPGTEEGKLGIAPLATTQEADSEAPKCEAEAEDEDPPKMMVAEASAKGKMGVTGEGPSVGKGKKRRSPAVLMEGSRCSRVNGRGWRCCQQTLVGYSLCEHHLGKGRIRSVNSVRCKKEPVKEEDSDPGNIGNKKNTKKKKIGMVKARSMSSLLHQAELSTTAAVSAVAASSGGCAGEARYICTR
ncbi:uncharacterized protein LOC144714016 isoform X2 [Wolffia australiana]